MFVAFVLASASVKNLALIKPPYSDGKSLQNPEALTDDDRSTYATQLSPGKHSLAWNFRGQYEISLFIFKLEEGVTYKDLELQISNKSTSGYVSVYTQQDFKQGSEEKGVFFIPARKASHVKFIVNPGDGLTAKFNRVEIWGIGDHDEGPTKYNGTRNDTIYTEMVWHEEFDGQELNLSRWKPVENVHFTHHVFTPSHARIKRMERTPI